jgi:WD40 repeat protein
MALHFHPNFANLLAVGCYDGRVLVFDVQAPGSQPLYASSTKTGKHNDPVWQVFWQVSPAIGTKIFIIGQCRDSLDQDTLSQLTACCLWCMILQAHPNDVQRPHFNTSLV